MKGGKGKDRLYDAVTEHFTSLIEVRNDMRFIMIKIDF